MCGIFGVISPTQFNPAVFNTLGELNKQRGHVGFGVAAGSGTLTILRQTGPFNAQLLALGGCQIALGHNCTPTAGQYSAGVERLHPFESAECLLAHNGLLLNPHLFPHWQLSPQDKVDSQLILGGIENYLQQGQTVTEAIAHTAGQLEGQQACWLWHKPTSTLYLWRVMAPLFVENTAASFAFSSLKTAGIQTLLTEGVVYQLTFPALQFTAVGSFPFYSPYKI